MPRPNRSKKKPSIEISDEESISTFSPPSPSGLFRTGEKREYPQSSPEKENQKPIKKTTKPMTTTASTPSIPSDSLFPGQYLSNALESLT